MTVLSKIFFKIIIFLFLFLNNGFTDTIKKIEVSGNNRISDETIKLFIDVKINDEIDSNKLNDILKNLYNTNFFEDINLSFNNQILSINVTENSIIESVFYKGIKSDKILNFIKDESSIRSRSSYNESQLKNEKLKIKNVLKNLGYYKSDIDILVEKLENNLVTITYDIKLGEKSKIKKITFIGNKIFKDNKLRNIITSSEYKFWKVLSGRKYLNQNSVILDERLLKNFYKNNGYYNVKINSTFAKLINESEF